MLSYIISKSFRVDETFFFFTINHFDYFKVETDFFKFVYTKATEVFLRKLTSMGDVWIVTVSQGLEWIKNPTTLDKIKDFKPWKCDTPAPPACSSHAINA